MTQLIFTAKEFESRKSSPYHIGKFDTAYRDTNKIPTAKIYLCTKTRGFDSGVFLFQAGDVLRVKDPRNPNWVIDRIEVPDNYPDMKIVFQNGEVLHYKDYIKIADGIFDGYKRA